ncbi:MAG TPA: host attachment protein [Solimonas sp.]|nr:host attachment protein [Solimonas sp.]
MAGTVHQTPPPEHASKRQAQVAPRGVQAGRALVIVADSARARILTSRSDGALEEALDLVNPEARLHEGELVADAAGRRGNAPLSGGHSAYGGGSMKRHRVEEFAAQVCDRAAKLQRAIRAQRVYFVAEPEFLGLLRKRAGLPLKRAIVGEVAKSITAQDLAAIRAVLPAQL